MHAAVEQASINVHIPYSLLRSIQKTDQDHFHGGLEVKYE